MNVNEKNQVVKRWKIGFELLVPEDEINSIYVSKKVSDSYLILIINLHPSDGSKR